MAKTKWVKLEDMKEKQSLLIRPKTIDPKLKSEPTTLPLTATPGMSDAYTAQPSRLCLDTITASNSKGKESEKASSPWRPDVYMRSFVPKAHLAINEAPASLIITQALNDINFEKYVSTFASQNLFKAPPEIPPPPLKGLTPLSSLDNLDPRNYGQHFQTHLLLDFEAQAQDIRSYDLYGAGINRVDMRDNTFALTVPGLRENSPAVNFGDTIILRQWIEIPAGIILGTGGYQPGRFGPGTPGFTGFEINAVVVAVNKATDSLLIRACGLLNFSQINCNVSFSKQARVEQTLRLAVERVARRLQHPVGTDMDGAMLPARASPDQTGQSTSKRKSSTTEKTSWLQHMLFPLKEYGIIRETLPSINFPQDWIDEGLNHEQKKAVAGVQAGNYGELCYLINGPPGTGKTRTICEIVTQLATDSTHTGSLLVCAPSNQAADTLALRLKNHFRPSSMLRLNHFSRSFAEVPTELMLYCCTGERTFDIPPIAQLMAYKIVVTTCQDADMLIQARVTNEDIYDLHRSMAKMIFRYEQPLPDPPLHWTGLIIDEAAQATEPESLIPLLVVTPPTANRKQPIFVLAGDQHQLSPRVYDKSTSLHVSLFERLSNSPVYAAHPLARKNMRTTRQTKPYIRPPFIDLIRNYRSHPAILAVPSSLFYSNTLIPEAASHASGPLSWPDWQPTDSSLPWPVQFRCNSGVDHCFNLQNLGSGWTNFSEALKAIECARDVLASGAIVDQQDICIMSPFRAQVRLLREIARSQNLHSLNVGPMEAFQGLESRFVIICTTRARRRFLKEDAQRGAGVIGEPKKFNVAVTRAKEGLVVIGNPWVLGGDTYWRAFLGFCWRNMLWKGEKHSVDKEMEGLQEGRVDEWEWKDDGGSSFGGVDPMGLERALLFKEEGDRWEGSAAARRFLGNGGEENEETWRSGVEAEEAVVEELDGSRERGSLDMDNHAEDMENGLGNLHLNGYHRG